jgi:hypothetical protein
MGIVLPGKDPAMSDPKSPDRDTESEEMARLSDPMSSEYDEGPTAPSGQQVRRSLDGKFVCPFCGSVNANTEEACPKCGMENTPATRNSTRARIGPWYVLQKRNPSAPGMKFDTLLRFVAKGRVNARTIVRGPTTSQLWRFAATVKGLSREFGLCYNCGGDVDKTATLCPHCGRNQQPPPDPDALLETKAPAPTRDDNEALSATMMPDETDYTPPPVEPKRPAPVANPFSTSGTVKPQPASVPKPQPAAENPVTAQMRREAQERKEIEEGRRQRETQRDVDRRDPTKHVPTLNAAELATAFQLGYKESAMRPRRHRRSHKKAYVWLTLLMFVGVAVVVYFKVPAVKSGVDNAYAASEAKVKQWVANAQSPSSEDKKVNEAVDRMTSVPPKDPAPKETPKSTTPAIPPTEVKPVEPPPVVKNEVKQEPKIEKPPVVKDEPKPEVKVETAVIPPPPPPPKKLTDDQAAEQVRKLWRQAMDCESRNDWAGAVSAYEEIKTLPAKVWPAPLDMRLSSAKAQLR